MYIENSRETTQTFLKRSITAMLTVKRIWNLIKQSVKIREGRKRGKDGDKKESMKESMFIVVS